MRAVESRLGGSLCSSLPWLSQPKPVASQNCAYPERCAVAGICLAAELREKTALQDDRFDAGFLERRRQPLAA